MLGKIQHVNQGHPDSKQRMAGGSHEHGRYTAGYRTQARGPGVLHGLPAQLNGKGKQLPKEHSYVKSSDGKRLLSCISSSYQTSTFNRLTSPTGSTRRCSIKIKMPPKQGFCWTIYLGSRVVVTHSLSLKITAKTTVPDVTGNWHASGVPVQKTGENPCYL